MLYWHTTEGHDGCTDRCRNIRTRSDKVAVFQFTMTCSHRPIFICFVSCKLLSCAETPRLRSIVQQAFSKNSPTFSSLQRTPESRVASHAVNPHQLQSTETRLPGL